MTVFPAINLALSLVEKGACSIEDVDLAACAAVARGGLGLPGHRGGLLYWAERELPGGLRTVAGKLKEWEQAQTQTQTQTQAPPQAQTQTQGHNEFAACALLRDCAAAGSTLREELFFRQRG